MSTTLTTLALTNIEPQAPATVRRSGRANAGQSRTPRAAQAPARQGNRRAQGGGGPEGGGDANVGGGAPGGGGVPAGGGAPGDGGPPGGGGVPGGGGTPDGGGGGPQGGAGGAPAVLLPDTEWVRMLTRLNIPVQAISFIVLTEGIIERVNSYSSQLRVLTESSLVWILVGFNTPLSSRTDSDCYTIISDA